MDSLTKSGKSSFQVMMFETSDLIQSLALAYGERQTIEQGHAFIASLKNNANKQVITKIFQVFAIDIIKNDLGFFMVRGAISQKAAKHAIAHQNALIKELAKDVDNILACFNVPFESLRVPNATDFQTYYSATHYGEVTERARL